MGEEEEDDEYEISPKSNWGDHEYPPAWLKKVESTISSTGTSISGTVQAFNTVKELNDQLLVLNPNNEEISKLKNSIDALEVKVEELQGNEDEIQKVKTFLKDNLDFVTEAAAIKGKFMGIESRLDGLTERVGHLDDRRKTSKQNTIAVWAIVISIAGLIVNILISLFMK